MAGAGSRFAKKGYIKPKPLIEINGIPMINVIINNIRPRQSHRFIFICQQQHIDSYGLRDKLSAWAPGCKVIEINGITEGAACTVLTSRLDINNNNPLMIANSDQFVDMDINDYLVSMETNHLDGLIMTMQANDPKWSFVGLDRDGLVNRVVEKEVISDEATVGIYNFRRGCDFVSAADEMISKNERVNNEFYVAPTYNKLSKNGRRIGIYNIGKEGDGMYGLGIPSDLDFFLAHPISFKATQLVNKP